MKQILHIFAKDVRHLWIEILISLALMVALVITLPVQWFPGMVYGFSVSFSPRGGFTFLPSLLNILVPLSWWILISPLVHEERLVGDRQFWLTRPYQWKCLLAAKTLFVIGFVFLPLFIAQCVMLAISGFNPLQYLPGLLFNLLLIACLLILPLIALAAVTRNFARMTLVVLGVLLCVVSITWLASEFPGTHIETPFGDGLSLVVVACGCTVVVTLQYARRRSNQAWLLLSAISLVVAALACAAPDQVLMSRRYPISVGSAPGIELSYQNDLGGGPVAAVAARQHQVAIWVPLRVSGISTGTMVTPQDLKVTIDGPDGAQWTSFWQPVYSGMILPGQGTARANFAMPLSLYEKLKHLPLRLHLDLALERSRVSGTTTIAMPLEEFRIPAFGICTPGTGFFNKPYEIGGVFCRSALRQPPLTRVEVTWAFDDCRVPAEQHRNVQGQSWVGSLDRPIADLAMVPIWRDGISFATNMNDVHVNEPRHICAGTPATFTTYLPAGRMQIGLDIQGFQLPELNHGQMRVILTPAS
jgi:hypothetical protein